MVKRNKSISIVVPVCNEIGNISQFHKEILSTMATCLAPYEIIYIDDYSTDGTFEWLEKAADQHIVKVVRKDGVKGKAFSLIQGFNMAKGDVLVMIDGDLQYPPSEIPSLVNELKSADVAVANREDYHDSKMRKFFSDGFKNVFGKMLFGLNTDIQSGMKAFKREVYTTVQAKPVSQWTFDLEFLYRARNAGYIIKNVPITFAPRRHGESKINVLSSTFEIGLNALYIKLKRTFYLPIQPEEGTMRGAGVGHKKRKYITHTTLPAQLSAIRTFSTFQVLFLLCAPIALISLFYLFPLPTARGIVALLSILYFVDALFNMFIVMKSMNKNHELRIADEELLAIDEATLPVYTILCPLYKEAHVVPQFLEGIAKIDWPKDKLDVMFLLEEDDVDTIAAFNSMTLPYYARTVIVPDSQPKTKPKACNYGLSFAQGEYLVIYDAEDMPDPMQLKKAYLTFKKVPENVTCLQAKLSYYNQNQNLLTRFFTAEYALWFDVTLPGLQSLNSALPLGGTSNHFKTDVLKSLHGWDPFNVTEDADLGVRLFQKGYRTAIIDSTTYEEATSVNKNWLRQRSRWIKGYMQTYLVHMRNIVPFVQSKGLWHNAIFQLTVGGKILFALLNPVMWLLTILYFSDYATFGPAMKAIYQPPFSYLAVTSWIFGNFMFLYSYMIAVAKRKQWDVTKYIILIPIYWLMMSTAAVIALYQLIIKPHYWEKTVHGFHLGTKVPEYKPVAQPVVQPVVQPVYAQVSAHTPEMPKKSFSSDVFLSISKYNIPSFILRWLPLFAILNVDLVLARYFLSFEDALVYIFLALFGKGLFILSQFGSNVVAAYATRNKASKSYLYRLIFFTFLFNWITFVVFGLEGNYIIPHIFNGQFAAVIPYIGYYLFGLLCFGLSYRLTTFNFYKKSYTYSIVSLVVIFLEAPFVYMHHDTISDIVITFAYVASLNLIVLLASEMSNNVSRVIENNLTSFLRLFEKPSQSIPTDVMRILIFNWRDTKHVYAGGAEVYVHEQAKRWVASGNKVTLFCGNDNKNAQYEVIDGVEVVRRGGTYTVYLFAFIYYLLKFRGKYDVVIDCENGIPFFTPLYVKEQVVLLIHHVHQNIFYQFLRFPLNLIASTLEGKIMPFVYQNKDVVTVSASSREDIIKLGFTKGNNIQIIPNGVDARLLGSQPKTDNPSYIYLGRLKDYKNVDVAIKAFAKVLHVQKDATLSIVGSGESYLELKRLVAKLGIGHAVTFYGRVKESEKAMLLAKSWAAIQPSQMEGWGITVIEANAAGTPVIASSVKGLQDSVINGLTGILVPARNVTQFANAMMRIATDHTLRMNLSTEAVLWSKNFDWDKSALTFQSLLASNIGRGSFQPMYADGLFSSAKKNVLSE